MKIFKSFSVISTQCLQKFVKNTKKKKWSTQFKLQVLFNSTKKFLHWPVLKILTEKALDELDKDYDLKNITAGDSFRRNEIVRSKCVRAMD